MIRPTDSSSSVSARSFAYERPRMHFSDLAPGRPCAKDPAVVRLAGRYWLYYSVPPEVPTGRWRLGVASSSNLLNWR